jgi:hypothetical protein
MPGGRFSVVRAARRASSSDDRGRARPDDGLLQSMSTILNSLRDEVAAVKDSVADLRSDAQLSQAALGKVVMEQERSSVGRSSSGRGQSVRVPRVAETHPEHESTTKPSVDRDDATRDDAKGPSIIESDPGVLELLRSDRALARAAEGSAAARGVARGQGSLVVRP